MQLFTYANEILPHLNKLYGRKNLADVNRYADVLANFRRCFAHKAAYLCSSPGRVELIGNHTDHNGGKVIACTIDLDIVFAFYPNGTDTICIAGKNRAMVRASVHDVSAGGRSEGLVKGVVRYLAEHGYKVGGFDAYTDSTVPAGAGVSSSAAFEIGVGAIISALFNDGAVPPALLAQAGRYAENVYFAKPCGLLDQGVIAQGGAVAFDFANGADFCPLDVDFSQLSFVLVNNGRSHSHLSELYAAIPFDMRAVANYFGKQRLVDVSPQDFYQNYDQVVRLLGEDKALRAKHFFQENARVEQLTALLQNSTSQQNRDPQDARQRPATDKADSFSVTPFAQQVISLINSSGDSSLYQLRNCATSPTDTEIADIISFARSVCPCGARVHGGGFAGTVLCVVPARSRDFFVSEASRKYGADKVLPLRLRPFGTTIL